MGILTEYVDIRLTSNVEYYEKLGYIIPRRLNKSYRLTVPPNTYIQVKVDDLPRWNTSKIDCQCDNCGQVFTALYRQYIGCLERHNGIFCQDCIYKLFRSGKNNGNWKGSISLQERDDMRITLKYKSFIQSILQRDNYTCQSCGLTNNHLHVHHLNGFNWCIEGRTDINNAVTLCDSCHENFHQIYGRGNNTLHQYEEWLSLREKIMLQNNNVLPNMRPIFCYEENRKYTDISDLLTRFNIPDISNIKKVCNHTVHTYKGLHFFWYDEYLELDDTSRNLYLEQQDRVIKSKLPSFLSYDLSTKKVVFNDLKEYT